MRHIRPTRFLVLVLALIVIGSACGNASSQQKNGESATGNSVGNTSGHSADHHDMVMKNGEKAMGFSQTATTHHFLLMKDGGAIRVEVNDPADTDDLGKIRDHLKEIASQFADGVFKTPFAVHGQVPPGVDVMEELKTQISYKFEETKNGAQVRISTGNAKALDAIHRFLKFQIEDHRTGDPLTVPEE